MTYNEEEGGRERPRCQSGWKYDVMRGKEENEAKELVMKEGDMRRVK